MATRTSTSQSTHSSSARASTRDRKQVVVEETSYEERISFYLSLLCASTGIASVAYAAHVRGDSFFTFAQYTLEVIEYQDTISIFPYLAMFIGLAVFVTSFFGGLFSLAEKSRAAHVSLTIMALLSIAEIGGSIYALDLITGLETRLQSADTVSREGMNAELRDFSLGVFESCCYQQGYFSIKGGTIEGECPDEPQDINDPPCFINYARFNYYNYTVGDFVCDTLEDAVVNLEGADLKTGNARVKLTSFTNNVVKVPVVGKHTDPTYGCGGGNAKAFQYLIFLWFKNTFTPLGIVALSCGCIQLVGVLMSLASLWLHVEGSQESAVDTYNRYMGELRAQQSDQQRLQRRL